MNTLKLAALAALFPVAALACEAHAEGTGMMVHDAYARAANPMAGAAFMTLMNSGTKDCTLKGASSPAAQVVELHTHKDEGGVMKMVKIEGGITIPAGQDHALARGGDHVMFMGLTKPWENGTVVPVTLDFGDCGTVETEVTVDNARAPDAGHAGHAMMPAPSN